MRHIESANVVQDFGIDTAISNLHSKRFLSGYDSRAHDTLKILMVFPFDFPGISHWEGSRTRLFSLSMGLRNLGYDVHILCKRDPDYSRDAYEGIRLHHYRVASSKSRFVKFLSPVLIGNEICRLDREFKFDVVHLHMPIVAASAELWKPLISAKMIFDTHDWYKLHDEMYYNMRYLPKSLGKAVDKLEEQIASLQDGVIVTSPLLRELLEGRVRTFVVPNAVDTNHFKPLQNSEFRKRYFPEDSFVIGFLGVVSKYQGVWKLLEAASIASKSIASLRVLVIGTGMVEQARLFSEKRGISERVVFTGPDPVPYSELPDLINAMDIGVSPLQKIPVYHEYAQPIKLLEYVSCGVPVIGTPLREQMRMINEGRLGWVAKGFDSPDLAEAVIKANTEIESLKDRNSLRDFAVSNFSNDIVLHELTAAYKTLLHP